MNASRLLSECTVLYTASTYFNQVPQQIYSLADQVPEGMVDGSEQTEKHNHTSDSSDTKNYPSFEDTQASACCRRKVYHPSFYCIKHRPFITTFLSRSPKPSLFVSAKGVGGFTACVRNARSRYDPPCILVMGGLYLRCLQVEKMDRVISKLNNESLFEKLVIRDE